MTDDQFDAYVAQVIEAARSDNKADVATLVSNLLSEFREKAYLEGRHMLIDNLHRAIDQHDDRKGYRVVEAADRVMTDDVIAKVSVEMLRAVLSDTTS